jgi:hypothetical protein
MRCFTGREVDWVQCDDCQLWFHLICVGLSKTDVSDDKDYICRTCEGRHLPAGVARSSGGELVPAAGDSYRARSKSAGGASSRSNAAFNSRVTRDSFVFDETVVQSAEIGHDAYVTATAAADDGDDSGGDGEYETQVVEYDTGDLDGMAVGVATELTVAQPEAVDMECHETLDADTGAPSGHVVIALGEDQVVYMYAGTGIEGMEDMVEIETVESAVDLQLHESCDQVSMDHVEEDSETCHELVLVDNCQTGVVIEQSATDCVQSEILPEDVEQEFVPVEGNDLISVADEGGVVSESQLIASVQCIPLSEVEHLGIAGIAIDGSNLIRSVTSVNNVVPDYAVAEYVGGEGAVDSYEVVPDADSWDIDDAS